MPIVCSVSTILIANFELRLKFLYHVVAEQFLRFRKSLLVEAIYRYGYKPATIYAFPLEISHTNQLPSASHSVSSGKRLCKNALFSFSGFSCGLGFATTTRETSRFASLTLLPTSRSACFCW